MEKIRDELNKFRTLNEQNNREQSSFSKTIQSLRMRYSGQLQEDHDQEDGVALIEDVDEPEPLDEPWTKIDYLILIVKMMLYLLLQALAFMIQFGAVFFAFAALFFICTNLRNPKKRRKGELSAYSVFNPGCEPIHGTLDAEKLTNQLTFGALHHI